VQKLLVSVGFGADFTDGFTGNSAGVLLVGFGIKIPLVPFHTWLPDTYVAASTPTVIMLGGVLAKLGTYGIFRFGLGLFPDAWSKLAPLMATWAAVSISLWGEWRRSLKKISNAWWHTVPSVTWATSY